MIAKALRILRQFHQLQKVELAEKLGLSTGQLSDIEAGKKPVNISLLNKYSELFDIPVSSLVFFSDSLDNEKANAKRFRHLMADNLLKVMDWVTAKNEKKKAENSN
ncbi:TPA: helix-turn-helix domain-containing protein [Photobacterium damselae]